jgi:hypothetical protein
MPAVAGAHSCRAGRAVHPDTLARSSACPLAFSHSSSSPAAAAPALCAPLPRCPLALPPLAACRRRCTISTSTCPSERAMRTLTSRSFTRPAWTVPQGLAVRTSGCTPITRTAPESMSAEGGQHGPASGRHSGAREDAPLRLFEGWDNDSLPAGTVMPVNMAWPMVRAGARSGAAAVWPAVRLCRLPTCSLAASSRLDLYSNCL